MMVEVWLAHRMIAQHLDGVNVQQVTQVDGVHLLVIGANGQTVHDYLPGTYHMGSIASYDPVTGLRMSGMICGSDINHPDPTCPRCHPVFPPSPPAGPAPLPQPTSNPIPPQPRSG